MGDLTYAQYVSYAVAMVITSTLSTICSFTLLSIITRDLSKVYHRTLFMVSVGDILLSITNAWHFFLLPAGKTNVPYAFGNDTTCSVVGFTMYTALLLLAIHGSFLSGNFLLQIKYQWTEEQIKKRVELPVHILAAVIAFTVPTLGVVSDSMSPSYETDFCMMVKYPPRCVESIEDVFRNRDDDTTEQSVLCERGVFASKVLAPFTSFTIYIFAMIGFVSTYKLYRTVQVTLTNSSSHVFNAAGMDQKQKERLKLVTWQCTLYALAYLNTTIWPVLVQILIRFVDTKGRLGDPQFYFLRLAAYCLAPLQGVIGLIVYVNPKYHAWKLACPDKSRVYLFFRAISKDDPPSPPSQKRAARKHVRHVQQHGSHEDDRHAQRERALAEIRNTNKWAIPAPLSSTSKTVVGESFRLSCSSHCMPPGGVNAIPISSEHEINIFRREDYEDDTTKQESMVDRRKSNAKIPALSSKAKVDRNALFRASQFLLPTAVNDMLNEQEITEMELEDDEDAKNTAKRKSDPVERRKSCPGAVVDFEGDSG